MRYKDSNSINVITLCGKDNIMSDWKEKTFGVLQRVGRSFMLPIAVLPVAGILLGLGSSFTNTTTLETYGLMKILGPGTILYSILTVMSKCGGVIFDNLPLIFAIGVAIGMAKKDKEVAALSAGIAFLVMHSAISAMITIYGGAEAMKAGMTGDVLGITTLQMGAFGGVIVGLGVAAIHNRFYKIQLPQALSFFGGNRFVPIISTLIYLIVGIAMFYIWQPVQNGIYALGTAVASSGYIGSFAYGLIKRLLIPFGLHHVFYMPFWQTAVGGTLEVAGKTIEGAQNIFFAQLADPNTSHFAVSATRFFTGEFIVMIFGLPGAALAMYKTARPEKKEEVKGLLVSSALTSILTGITEPIEFSFLFVAPLLFGVHSVLTGLAYAVAHILNITVGLTFSGGFIDLFMFGILQGNSKTNWLLIIPAGIVYFIVYYFVFIFLIKKLNLKTPGREADDEETKLYTRADYNAKKEKAETNTSLIIANALGGKANIEDVDCCATRLRITVKREELVNESVLKTTGAHGIIRKGKGIQVIYGPKVNIVKVNLEDYLETAPDTFYEEMGQEVLKVNSEKEKKVSEEGKRKLKESISICSPMNGTVMPVEQVPDEGFAQKMMGDGIAIAPEDGNVYAPVDGTISFVFPSKHALGISLNNGVQMLIHFGIDTVSLNGEGFEVLVSDGDIVQKGDLLMKVSIDTIKDKVPSLITPVLISDMEDNMEIVPNEFKKIKPGDKIFTLNIYH